MTMQTAEAEVSLAAEAAEAAGFPRRQGERRRYAKRFLFFDQAVSVSRHWGDG